MDDRTARYAESLSQMIKHETISVNGQTDLAKFYGFHDLMRELFPHIFKACSFMEHEGSFLMRWPGKNPGQKLLLMNHHDVVEATGEWKHTPFSGEIAEGKVWGRGAIDDKGELWAMFRAADELAAEGFVPEYDIWFESACTEETDGSGAENLIVKTLGARHPQASGLSSVDDDGHVNREDYLYMNGSAIFNFTLETVPRIMDELLDKSHLEKDGVDYYVFHQANKFMLSTLRKICKIPQDRFHIDLEHCGNTVSPTILIGLKDCLDRGTILPGMTVMVCGFGVGLSYGATLIQF